MVHESSELCNREPRIHKSRCPNQSWSGQVVNLRIAHGISRMKRGKPMVCVYDKSLSFLRRQPFSLSWFRWARCLCCNRSYCLAKRTHYRGHPMMRMSLTQHHHIACSVIDLQYPKEQLLGIGIKDGIDERHGTRLFKRG